MGCLSDKIFLNGYCDTDTPVLGQIDVSNFISLDVLSAIANNTNTTAKEVHNSIVAGLNSMIYSTFLGVLNSNGFAPNYATGLQIYDTAVFVNTNVVSTSGQTGVTITRSAGYNPNSIKRVKITEIRLWFAAAYTNVTVNIASGGIVTQYLIPSVAIGENVLVLPTAYSTSNGITKVYLDGAYQMQTVKSSVSCLPCAAKQAPCATASGLYNGANSSNVMYGISVRYTCGCDYEYLYCQIINSGALDTLIALEYENLYWLRAKNSGRANINSSYTAEVIQYNINALSQRITEERKMLKDNILPIIRSFNDHECIICVGIQNKPIV